MLLGVSLCKLMCQRIQSIDGSYKALQKDPFLTIHNFFDVSQQQVFALQSLVAGCCNAIEMYASQSCKINIPNCTKLLRELIARLKQSHELSQRMAVDSDDTVNFEHRNEFIYVCIYIQMFDI